MCNVVCCIAFICHLQSAENSPKNDINIYARKVIQALRCTFRAVNVFALSWVQFTHYLHSFDVMTLNRFSPYFLIFYFYLFISSLHLYNLKSDWYKFLANTKYIGSK